jgi:hypothetical protein
MGLKLNVGVSRKVGQPDFGSLGATCNLELELDGTLLERDPAALQARIREAYQAAHQAVQDELARLTSKSPGTAVSTDSHPTRVAVPAGLGEQTAPSRSRWLRGSASNGSTGRSPKPATTKQIGAIAALARRAGLDLHDLLTQEYGVAQPEALTLAQASELIDRLRAEATS